MATVPRPRAKRATPKSSVSPPIPQIGRRAALHLYIQERQDKIPGLTDERLAGRLGIDRVTVWKWKRRPQSLDGEQLARLAFALDCEVLDLNHPPGRSSIDAQLMDDPELHQKVAEIVQTLRKTGT